MKRIDEHLREGGASFTSRRDILEKGGTDRMIAARIRNGIWSHPHPGVYRLGPDPTGWLERLDAAVRAAGPSALVSHRAAYALWALDGIDAHLVEITVPYNHAPIPAGVIRHRTRREMAREIVKGVPVTSVERTLLDAGRYLSVGILMKGIDCALRREITTPARLWEVADLKGGRGVPGAGRFKAALTQVEATGTTGSPAEVEILAAMTKAGIPTPVPQWEIVTPSGRRYLVDFGWPNRMKGVEVDGLDAHSGAELLERDLIRQNDLMDAGVQLRRFTGRQVRRDRSGVVESIRRFLAEP